MLDPVSAYWIVDSEFMVSSTDKAHFSRAEWDLTVIFYR